MKRKILEKLLVSIMIITLSATDFLTLGANLVSYATDLSKTTNNNNIEFSTYFKDAEGNKVDTVQEDINKEDLKLYAEIAVKREGYFNGTIELQEGNFNFKNTASEGISHIDGNKITLNQINAGSTVEIELGIAPVKSEQMMLSQLNMTSKIKLAGTYMETSYKGKDISAEKNVTLNLIADEANSSAEVSNEIVTNKIFNVNGENKRIVQMLVKSKITNNNYPVKQTTLTAEVPETNKDKLQKIEVVALRTEATNGQENNTTVTSSTTENGAEIQNTQITVENAGETISWKRNTSDEFIVTYIYDENANVNGTEFKTNTEIELYNTENKFSKETSAIVGTEELSNVVVSEIELDNTETYKGQLYANTKTEDKKEIPFNTTTKILVRSAGIAEAIDVKEEKDTFTGIELDANTRYVQTAINRERMLAMLGQDGYLDITAGGTSYRLTKDSEVNENGNIIINYNETVREIEISTSKPVNAGVLNIQHEKAIMASDYVTEQIKPVTGLIAKNISTMKATIDTTVEKGVQEAAEKIAGATTDAKNSAEDVINGGVKEAGEKISGATTDAKSSAEDVIKDGVKEAGEKISEVISKNENSAEKPLKETYSKVELTVNKANLSTMSVNNDVALGVKFITNGTQYDLFKNPKVVIQLPEQVKDVTLKGIDKLYGDEFTITKKSYDKVNKMIEIELNGEQTAYAENDATQLYLQVNLDITLEQTAASKTEEITMSYKNDNATNYYEDGIVTKAVGITAPSGIITINNLNTYNINSVAGINESKQLVDLDKETAGGTNAEYQISVVNNTGSKINNTKILGYFPTKGEIQTQNETITNTLETSVAEAIKAGNAKVYYSENSKATADLENTSNGWTQDTSAIANAKVYLIDLGTMNIGASYTTGYTSKISTNIDYDLSSYAGYKVIYNDGETTQTVESTLVGMTTEGGIKAEDIKMETSVSATVGNDTLKDGDIVKAGEVIRYKVTAKNAGERKLKDVTIKGQVPDGTVLVEPEEEFKSTGLSYYVEKTDAKEVSKTIESIEPGQEYSIEYEVRVNMNATNGTEITNKEITTCGEFKQEGSEMKLKLAESKIRVTLKKLVDADIDSVYTGEYMEYTAFVENLSNEAVKDITLKINTTGVELGYLDDSEGNDMEKTNEIKISEIAPNEKIGYSFSVEIKEDAIKEFDTSVIVKDADGNEYRANKVDLKINQHNAKVSLTTPNNGDYVEPGDEIKYEIEITNSENSIQVVKVHDNIPEELEIQEIIENGETVMQITDDTVEDTFVGNISNQISYPVILEPNGTTKITIITKVRESQEQSETKTIKNLVEVKTEKVLSGELQEITLGKSEEVTHIIKGTISEEMKHIISGVAWLDANGNGQKDTDETVLQDITVRLLDTKTNKLATDRDGNALETKTGEDGTYTFSKVEEGQYIVVFDYDTTKYEPTAYMQSGVSDGLNSKAIAKVFDGEVKGNAGTDTIELTESVFNINLGLKQNLKFDLELGKYINSIVVQNSKGTKTYECKDGEIFKKIEINSKQLDGSVVVLNYTIRVKNTGEVAGYVSNIRDYLPSGLTFSSELNPDWYLAGQDLYTKSLANARIEPGEVKEIKLVLTKTMTSDNVGLVNNRAEIAESYNELGKVDIDSTENNQTNGEDDLGSADAIIGVSTGMTNILNITLIIINTGLIAFAIYLLFRKKNETK